jgi:hypothetical protein
LVLLPFLDHTVVGSLWARSPIFSFFLQIHRLQDLSPSHGACNALCAPLKIDSRYPSIPDGLAHNINSLEQYPSLANNIPKQKALIGNLGHPQQFDEARKETEVNALVAE